MTAIHDSTKSGLGLGVSGHDLSCPEEDVFLFLGREAILKYYRKANNINKINKIGIKTTTKILRSGM